MKRKVGTIIEEEIMKLAKRQAVEENRSLSDLIQEALAAYLRQKAPERGQREAAYRLFCEQPIRINKEQFEEILNDDPWDI